jgi:hypothetical protein
MSVVRARPKASWPVPVALVAVSTIPLTAGTLRLIQLAGGPAVIPADARFIGFPVALVVHIVGAAVFAYPRPPLRVGCGGATFHRVWGRPMPATNPRQAIQHSGSSE